MRALYVILPILGILTIAYRYYSAFIAAKVMVLDDSRPTPAHVRPDRHNYHATTRWVLFGHHFAAIAGAGPLIGPVLAAQFGYAPGLIWLVGGVCLAGAVHDMIVLWASTRRGGASLADIARSEIGPVAGITAAVAILFIIIIALAGLGLAVVNALEHSAWGTFTIGMSIPLALGVGWYMYQLRPGRVAEATIIGVAGLLACVVLGKPLASSSLGHYFLFSRTQLILLMAGYGFIASVLPVWLLLAPRDYLSSFMKIGTIALLIVGVIVVNPVLQMPAFSQFTGGGGPIVPGPLFPFAFITIACGAISGFHALISSGTTPKMIDKESDIRVIGYGAMLMEGVVGIVSIIAASAMHPGDYFAINTPPAVFATLGLSVTNLPALEAAVQETVTGRTGGAVSLAIGMAQIRASRDAAGDYWTLRDHVQAPSSDDDRGNAWRDSGRNSRPRTPFAHHWMPGAACLDGAVVAASGPAASTIWPMFRDCEPAARVRRAGGRHVTSTPAGRVRVVTRVCRDHDATAGAMRSRQLYQWPRPNPRAHFRISELGVTSRAVACVLDPGAGCAGWRLTHRQHAATQITRHKDHENFIVCVCVCSSCRAV